jgi:hypothetical protein
MVRYVSLVGLLTACGGQAGGNPPEPTAAVTEPIYGGTTVQTDTIGTPWLVNILARGGCTGTLLTPTWVSTARHCVTTNGGYPGTGIVSNDQIFAQLCTTTPCPSGKTEPPFQLQASGVEIVSNFFVNGSVADVALVRLNTYMINANGQIVDGELVPVNNRIYRGPTAGLGVGSQLYAQGWGLQSGPNGPAGCPNDSVGGLTSALIPLASTNGGASNLACNVDPSSGFAESYCFAVSPNPAGQLPAPGDSGSSLFPVVQGIKRPFGIFSTGQCQNGNYIQGDLIRDWMNAVTGYGPSVGGPTGYERSDGDNAVNYEYGGHPKELALPSGSGWELTDYTNSPIGAPASQGSSGLLSQYIRTDSKSAVVYVDIAGNITELSLAPGGRWVVTVLNGDQNALGSTASGFVRSDQTNSVIFEASFGGTKNMPMELTLSPGSTGWPSLASSWSAEHWLNTNAPAESGPPVGYMRPDAANAVVYRSTVNVNGINVGHVEEIAMVNGTGTWNYVTDLSAASTATDGPLPNVSSTFVRVRPFTRADGIDDVLFVDTNDNIQQIWLPYPYTQWFNGPAPNAKLVGSDLGAYIRKDGHSVVLYADQSGDVHELAVDPLDTGWTDTDLTASASPHGVAASSVAPAGYVRSDGYDVVVYQAKSGGHIHELSTQTPWLPTTWFDTDLTIDSGGTL